MECNKYQKSFGVAFNVVFEDKVRRPPKKLPLVEKEPLTLEQIKKKQQLADRRRQERIAARLKRMQQREESTKKLTQSVAILLQQQSLRTGEIKESSDVPKMSRREIMKTANEVSQRFQEMQCQLLSMDLNVDETAAQLPKRKDCSGDRASKVSLKQLKTKKGNTCSRILSTGPAVKENPSELNERKAKGTTFKVPVNEVKKTSQKKPISLQTKNWKSDRKLTVEELNEKQQRAAERRQKRKEEKVRKTREGRETLMELQGKVNIYVQHQEALNGDVAEEKMLSEQDAACLAHEIADGFSKIHSRYETDLDRAEGFSLFH